MRIERGALQVVRAVHVPAVLFAPLYVALERGYFRRLGIQVDLSPSQAGQDAMPLLATGKLEMLVGGFSAATFNAITSGIDVRVVASMGQQPKQGYPSAPMVRKDLLDSGSIKTIADLRGRKVALSGGMGAAGSYWMATKLRPAGLSLKNIEIVNLGFPDMIVAFQTKAIDAAFPSAPSTTQIKSQGTADFFGGQTAPGASAVGVLLGGPFMKNHPELAEKIMVALIEGARDVQGAGYSSPENLQAYGKYTNAPLEILKNLDRYDFDPDLTPNTATLLDMQRVFAESGAIAAAPLSADQIVNATFQQAAARQRGPYSPQ